MYQHYIHEAEILVIGRRRCRSAFRLGIIMSPLGTIGLNNQYFTKPLS